MAKFSVVVKQTITNTMYITVEDAPTANEAAARAVALVKECGDIEPDKTTTTEEVVSIKKL